MGDSPHHAPGWVHYAGDGPVSRVNNFKRSCVCRRLPVNEMMNGKTIACLAILGPLVLIGCAGSSSDPRGATAAEINEVAATGTEQAVVSALNAERRAAGKAELTVSPVLTRLARGESDAAAATARLPGDTTAVLQARSGFHSLGKLQGVLKDRGAATGKAFVDYWAQGSRGMVMDDWGKVGVGASKAADGRLFAVVVLGGAGGRGSSLMNPGMPPNGY